MDLFKPKTCPRCEYRTGTAKKQRAKIKSNDKERRSCTKKPPLNKPHYLNKKHYGITITLLAIISCSITWANTDSGFTLEQGDLEVVDGTVKATKFIGTGSTPIGSVIAFMGMEVPNGWMTANGAEISRAEYPELFSAIGVIYGSGNNATTFNIPDLRGEFIRGWDDGRGVDNDRQLGSYQADAFQGHHHDSYQVMGHETGNHYSSSGLAGALNTSTSSSGNFPNVKNPTTDGLNGAPRTGPETRPRNIAVMYIIRVK